MADYSTVCVHVMTSNKIVEVVVSDKSCWDVVQRCYSDAADRNTVDVVGRHPALEVGNDVVVVVVKKSLFVAFHQRAK